MDGLDEQPKQESPTRALLTRALKRARGSLLWERLWPALATLATALGLFLAFSWAGLWLVLPPLARAIGLLLFVVITAIAAVPLVLLRLPSVNDGLRRLDRSSGETHRLGDRVTVRLVGAVVGAPRPLDAPAPHVDGYGSDRRAARGPGRDRPSLACC